VYSSEHGIAGKESHCPQHSEVFQSGEHIQGNPEHVIKVKYSCKKSEKMSVPLSSTITQNAMQSGKRFFALAKHKMKQILQRKKICR
jgi:hypothetical protein